MRKNTPFSCVFGEKDTLDVGTPAVPYIGSTPQVVLFIFFGSTFQANSIIYGYFWFLVPSCFYGKMMGTTSEPGYYHMVFGDN